MPHPKPAETPNIFAHKGRGRSCEKAGLSTLSTGLQVCVLLRDAVGVSADQAQMMLMHGAA